MIAFVGNPNTGKSTLFNALTTGTRASVSNFTGTTVDVLKGTLTLDGREIPCVDIPGTYSLAGRSPEEWVAVREILGLSERPTPELIVFLADAVRLERSLYLALQVLDLGVPMVIAVNLIDEARAQGLSIRAEAISVDFGVPVVPISARSGEGLACLRQVLREALADPPIGGPHHGWPDAVTADVEAVQSVLPPAVAHLGASLARIVLLSLDDPSATPGLNLPLEDIREVVTRIHSEGRDPVTAIVQTRYRWLDSHAPTWRETPVASGETLSDRIDRVLLHPLGGTVVFGVVMGLVFTALFTWADPFIGAIEGIFALLGEVVTAGFGASPGPYAMIFRDFLVDGLIGGVGAILVFLPQIAMLFFFIGLLEDSGYLSRAAYLVDRVLRMAGLPGRAFVPLLSGYACAVPAIMATRSMPRFRDRLLTMLVLPLTSCSARLPIYTLIIAALFPVRYRGFPFVQPAMLLGMYLFSTVLTVTASVLLGRLVLPDEASAEFIELVPYRLPSVRVVLGSTYRNARHFVRDAGRMILVATVVLWALLYFPHVDGKGLLTPEVVASAEAQGLNIDEVTGSLALERSFGGQIGHAIEPVIAPLGMDWRMGVGVLGAFAAREVFVSTMGLVYGIEDADEHSHSLRQQIATQRRVDGTRVWTPLVGMSLMVFFALAMQCTSTLAVMAKETRSLRWPAFVFTYMTILAYAGSFMVYQLGLWLGFR